MGRNSIDRTGERYINKEGCEVEIIKWVNSSNCTIMFDDGIIYYNVKYINIKRGTIKNLYTPKVFKKGFLGIGKYKATTNGKINKNYGAWTGMLRRCYDKKLHDKYPTYSNTVLCEEWHNFQNFAEWYENNFKEGYHLDKDILIKGNKVYSPETCCFVPHEINTLFVKNDTNRGDLPIGVTKQKDKFIVSYTKSNNTMHLGTFNTPEEAFQAYKISKESHIKEMAEKYKHQISEEVYKIIINYKVEITD